jgi:peptidyl-prolyl cis-trans isomerase C
MELRRILFIMVIVGLFASLAVAQEEDPVIGKAGDFVMKKSDFERLMSFNPPERRKALEANPQQKGAILKRIMEHRVISERARKEGFDQTPEIKEQLQYILNDVVAQEYLKKVVLKDVTVTEEEMKKYYQANEKTYTYPAQAKVRHILVKVAPNAAPEEKKKAREKAEALLKRIKDGEDFAKLAGEFSEDPASQKKGGDLGYFSKGRMVKPFEEAAFTLKAGQVSDIVETQFGFHIIKGEDVKEARIRSFDEVKETVRSQLRLKLQKEKTDQFLEKVVKESGMEVYPDKLTGQKK